MESFLSLSSSSSSSSSSLLLLLSSSLLEFSGDDDGFGRSFLGRKLSNPVPGRGRRISYWDDDDDDVFVSVVVEICGTVDGTTDRAGVVIPVVVR